MPRVLLILPTATYRAADFLAAADRLGAEVVVASEHRQALSAEMGGRALVVSLADPDRAARRIAERAATLPLDAVVAGDDRGTRAAARAAALLGLRASEPAAVDRAGDKALMRAALAAAGVPQPAYRRAAPGDDVAALAHEVRLPCVVKPLTLSASRGVIRADTPAAALAAARRIRAMLGDDDAPLLVERFVAGPEVSLEGLLRDGSLETLAVFDKPDPLDGPYFEETIYVTPSRLPGEIEARVAETAARAAAAIGLSEGPIHAELRIGAGGPIVIEVAGRTIGGLCARTLRFGLGTSLEELVLRHALAMPLDGLERERAAAGVMMLPIPAAGTLTGVGGVERARAVPGIAGVELTIPPGRPVVPLPEGDRYLGFVFARGEQPADVERALRAAHAKLDVAIA